MNGQASCPECGKPLLGGSTHGLCPACLMGQAMASRTFDPRVDNTQPAPPPSPEEIADNFPQFEILKCLGRGGMGVVYKARQKSLDRWVAIKVLAPERVHDERFAEHFEREAKTLAKMSHPNIVTVFDHGQTGELFYIVMEYVDGVNLRDLLRDGKMEPEQALAVVPPICEALDYAHGKGVVHRDIKPENLLLDRDGRVKIADFGIASLVGATGEKSGTPPYMAPEQELGVVDRRADIYALGAVLYEMLTGERPSKDLVAPSKRVEVDVKIDEMVLRALEKEPELRYQTAGEFRTVAESITDSANSAPVGGVDAVKRESGTDRQCGSKEGDGVRKRRRRIAWASALVVAAIAAWYFMGTSTDHYVGAPDTPRPTDSQDAAVWDAIRLYGVLPDGGSDIFDKKGNPVGQGPSIGPWQWKDEDQACTLVFNFPQEASIQWKVFPEVYVSRTGRRIGGGLSQWTADYLGQTRRIQALEIDRAYNEEGTFGGRHVEPIDKVDITLCYYLPGRRNAAATFKGPFKFGESVKAEEGFAATITPEVETQNMRPETRFQLSATNVPLEMDTYDCVLAYDFEGNRYRVDSGRRSTHSSGEGTTAEHSYRIDGLNLSELAVITIGELPQRKTFRNISLRPSGRQARSYPPYLDAMASILGLESLPIAKLQDYKFRSVDEAIKAVDVLQGPHLDRAWALIERADFSTLSTEQKETLKNRAQEWIDEGQTVGILLGLKGKWPEFVEPALERLQQAQRDRTSVVSCLKSYPRFSPEQLDEIVGILEEHDDPRGLHGLLSCLGKSLQGPGGLEALERLADSKKVWLWWPALKYLTESGRMTVAQLDRRLQVKYLAMTDPDRWLNANLAAEARMLLTKLPSPQLAAMSTSTTSEVLRSVIENLARVEAEAVLLDLLEDMAADWNDPAFQYEGYSPSMWWPIDRAVRQLNHWHELDLGGIGSDIERETTSSGMDWPKLAREVLVHFGRRSDFSEMEDTVVETSGRPITITLTDLLDRRLAHAVVDLRPAASIRVAGVRPELIAGGRPIRGRTDARGRLKIQCPFEVGGRKVFRLVGTVTHPDLGTAPLCLVYSISPKQQVALAPEDSPLHEHALRGQVVDESGRPVVGALINSNRVEVGERRIGGKGEAITDSTGRFIMPFVPRSGGSDSLEALEDAVYSVVARASGGAELFPARVEAESPVRMVLQPPQLAPRRIRFEVGDGEFAKAGELLAIRLTWSSLDGAGGDEIQLGHRYLSGEAVPLAPGRYRAAFHDGHGRSFDFLPVVIDANSPDVITFVRPPAVSYRGRVVDGRDDTPITGAFVFLYSGGRQHGNLAMLTEEDWDVLDTMPTDPPLDHPGVEILKRHYVIEAIGRTDEEGRYAVTRGREDGGYGLISLARHSLPFQVRLNKLQPDAQHQAKVPDAQLYPAASVQFIPQVQIGESPSFYLQWSLEADDQPTWLEKFEAVRDNLQFNNWLDLSAPLRVSVPAGISLKIRFQGGHNEKVKALQPDKSMQLNPGEIRDIGTVEFVVPED